MREPNLVDTLRRLWSDRRFIAKAGLVGAVVATVIGKHMYLYDVWGEAVNTASRMESHGVAGRVQVSEGTRRLLSEQFLLEERGALEVGGGSEMKTWFVVGRNGASH